MNTKMIFKICVDFAMTVILVLLMAFEMIGRSMHEWLGAAMFLLFMIHHYFNLYWIKNISKGNYTIQRKVQNVLDLLIFFTALGSMISGVALSETVLSFVPITGGTEFFRIMHMLSAYWGYILISIHIGCHFSIFYSMVKKINSFSKLENKFRIFAFLSAIYGAYAFFKRGLIKYMFLRTHFVMFDFDEPVIFFLTDYVMILWFFAYAGHNIMKKFKQIYV